MGTASSGEDPLTIDITKAKQQALYYLKFRSRSSAEMRRYLNRKGYQAAIQEAVVSWLQELGYVDDLQFALQWIENRCRTNPMGERRLVQELRQKGIPQPIIDQAMVGFRESVDETALACKLATKQVRVYRGDDTDAIKRKLAGFLGRRGFHPGDIRSAIDQVLSKE